MITFATLLSWQDTHLLSLNICPSHQNDTFYFGPLTGRVAQRMARGRFVLDGKVYHTYLNDGRNAIHGVCTVCLLPSEDCCDARTISHKTKEPITRDKQR
jgi:galactose mutarotase-like enzyme